MPDAVDIKRLRQHVERFKTPFVEVRFQQRMLEIAEDWPLYRYNLAELPSLMESDDSDSDTLKSAG